MLGEGEDTSSRYLLTEFQTDIKSDQKENFEIPLTALQSSYSVLFAYTFYE